jgi:hypothetical protein
MSADAAAPLVAAAKQRHELTRARAIQAIRELDRAGTAVTFTAVAGQAQVSRSWLGLPAGHLPADPAAPPGHQQIHHSADPGEPACLRHLTAAQAGDRPRRKPQAIGSMRPAPGRDRAAAQADRSPPR